MESHSGQLSLAVPPLVGAMSTGESWDVYRHTAQCTGPVSVISQCKLVSAWGLRKRRSATPYWLYGSERTLRFFLFFGHQFVSDAKNLLIGARTTHIWDKKNFI